MVEYDVDLKTLEDMCSELSEACVLVNKDIKIFEEEKCYYCYFIPSVQAWKERLYIFKKAC